MDYAKAFRMARAAFGLSQAELATLLKIGPSQVSLIEAGKRQPSHKVIDNLAASLKIPPHLITLLALEPHEIDLEDDSAVAGLAQSLLKLIVNASGEKSQLSLPFSDPKKRDE